MATCHHEITIGGIMIISNHHGEVEFSEQTIYDAHDFVVLQMKQGKPAKFYWLVKKFASYYKISTEQAKVLADHVLHMVPAEID
jgi:hypothetical protein